MKAWLLYLARGWPAWAWRAMLWLLLPATVPLANVAATGAPRVAFAHATAAHTCGALATVGCLRMADGSSAPYALVLLQTPAVYWADLRAAGWMQPDGTRGAFFYPPQDAG